MTQTPTAFDFAPHITDQGFDLKGPWWDLGFRDRASMSIRAAHNPPCTFDIEVEVDGEMTTENGLTTEQVMVHVARLADLDCAYCGHCDHHADAHTYGAGTPNSVPCSECEAGTCRRPLPPADADATAPQPTGEHQADEPKCDRCGEPDPLNLHLLGCEDTCEHGVPMDAECEPCKP